MVIRKVGFIGVCICLSLILITMAGNLQYQTNSSNHLYTSINISLLLKLHTQDYYINSTLVNEGFTPLCNGILTIGFCNSGIVYYKDPTTVITNQGHDYIQFIISGTANAVVPGTTDRANVEGLSSSATGAAVADCFSTGDACSAQAGPCDTANIFTTNGLTPVAGTVTAGVPSAGSVTWSISNTFTDATASSTVNAGCVLTELTGGAHPYIFAESSGIGPFTLQVGNTLQEIWQVTAT